MIDGPKMTEEGHLDLPPPEMIDGQIIVEVRGTIDKLIARAVAKIAFNYMAKHAGTEFALDRCIRSADSSGPFPSGCHSLRVEDHYIISLRTMLAVR